MGEYSCAWQRTLDAKLLFQKWLTNPRHSMTLWLQIFRKKAYNCVYSVICRMRRVLAKRTAEKSACSESRTRQRIIKDLYADLCCENAAVENCLFGFPNTRSQRKYNLTFSCLSKGLFLLDLLCKLAQDVE
jgi:hypothetical protein